MSTANMSVNVKGKTVEFCVESGVAMGVRRLSETHVRGNVSQGSGHISSTVVHKTEFALICTDGIERPHWFSSHKLYLRDGHRVSLIHASYRSGMWAYIVNHDTRETLNVWDPADYIYHLGLVRRIGCLWFVLAIAAVIGLVNAAPEVKDISGQLIVGSLSSLVLLKIIQWWRACRIWNCYLCPEFERIEKDLLASTGQMTWDLP